MRKVTARAGIGRHAIRVSPFEFTLVDTPAIVTDGNTPRAAPG
jgi:hypothetical protein